MDIVEIKGVGVTEEDVRDRVRWRQLINCGEQEEVWYWTSIIFLLLLETHTPDPQHKHTRTHTLLVEFS